MANSINSISTGTGGLQSTADGTSGNLLIQKDAGTIATFSSTGVVVSGVVAATTLTGDGSALTGISSGGMTLLSTTAATGAATINVATNHTLYNQLMIVFKQVELSGTSGIIQVGVAGYTPMSINDVNSTASTTIIGLLTFDLNANQYWQEMQVAAVGPITTGNQFNGGSFQGMGQFQVDQNLRASSSANVSFKYSSGANFDGGSILIYGLK